MRCTCSSCKDTVSFRSYFLSTVAGCPSSYYVYVCVSLGALAALPVAIRVGVPVRRRGVRTRHPSTNFGRGGGCYRKSILQLAPLAFVTSHTQLNIAHFFGPSRAQNPIAVGTAAFAKCDE